ncbi:MAG: hypothetical protein O2930_12725 [Acidobacteria bacterium]|nr:hypothetical protein [Acidobacteriota bacterium]
MEFLVWLQSRPLAVWVAESTSLFAYPTFLLFHTIGLAVVVGANVVLDLRVLGAGRRIPLDALRKIFSPMWVGFALNAASGAVLFAASAEFTGVKPIFYVKLGSILAAMIVMSLIRRSVFGVSRTPDRPVPNAAKAMALASLLLWAGAITAGRYTAYM